VETGRYSPPFQGGVRGGYERSELLQNAAFGGYPPPTPP